ncbi:DUF4893 domain-containing protein [Rubellimicrobium sp. CFH 75288]|uniref:DUF4893 domain-containing protein n=1 Tax=Rubellimicrobium sp. CFH 75288 TaxID=2697034 RepID=UPI001412918A|nr:DUF4893 domain-containing protein [Rubellimicrobium sp. CFH 75288]NAZ35960.1 DUF4893 domain-containing protein [Rubellimicrobium sp. CFH 75288]
MRHAAVLCLALWALALPLAAQPHPPGLRPADTERWEAFDAHLGRALRQALAAGDPADIAVLTDALAGTPDLIRPEGEWSCRTIKMGGLVPLTVYGAFRCRVTADGPDRWRIEKLTGSQRLVGHLLAGDGGLSAAYLGVGFVAGGPAMPYAKLPPADQTPQEPGQTIAQVGLWEQPSPDRARLLMPAPLLESEFDLLVLSR